MSTFGDAIKPKICFLKCSMFSMHDKQAPKIPNHVLEPMLSPGTYLPLWMAHGSWKNYDLKGQACRNVTFGTNPGDGVWRGQTATTFL